jgi:hypothetical protein
VHFDADAYAATLTPPTLTVGGVAYRGRHLSAAQWTAGAAAVDRANKAGSLTAWAQAAQFVFGAMYDPPWWMLWKRRPSRVLLAQPPAVWQAALATFFGSLATSGPTVTTTVAPLPDGPASSPDSSPATDSPPGTPPATGRPETA